MTSRVLIRDMERLMGRIADQIADKVQELQIATISTGADVITESEQTNAIFI